MINTAAAGCSGSGTNTVTCTDADIGTFGANLGDMDDRLEDNANFARAGSFGNSWVGGSGGDTMIGSDNPLRSEGFVGQSGNDTMDGRAGAEAFQGDEGNDTLDGGGDVDNLDGGEGADVVNGGDGDDRLGENRDGVQDVLSGGNGEDLFPFVRFTFPPPAGDDLMDGGAGVDQVVYEDFNFVFFQEPNEPAIFTLWDSAQNDTIGESTFNLLNMEDVDTTSTGGGPPPATT